MIFDFEMIDSFYKQLDFADIGNQKKIQTSSYLK